MPSPQRSLADLIRPGMVDPGRRTRRLSLRILIGLLLVAVLGVLASAGLYFLGGPKASHVKGLGKLPAGEPMNVLVLGSDSREGLSKEELRKYDPRGTDRRSGRRSDTIMLLHVDPNKDKAVMVSFPRDLRIRHPNGSLGRINAIYQQGPSAMVQAVKKYTGLPIHHYVEVNFEGFKNIVDTVGGVDVFFERPIRERDSGLNVRKGCVHLVGDQALAFVRIRKIDSDFGRIARQQLFLRLMVEKVTQAKILINPVKIVKLVDILSKNVTTDTGLTLGDLKGLALQLRGLDQSHIDMRMVPGETRTIGGVSYVIGDDAQAQAIFAAIRERRTLPDYGLTGVTPIANSDIDVSILNGSGTAGIAKTEADKLEAEGFPNASVGDATPHEETTVYYRVGNEGKAAKVAARYGADVSVMPSTLQVPGDIALVLGRDFAEGRATPSPPLTNTKPEPKPLIHECP